MNISSLKNRTGLFILLCLLAIALIYAINIFPIAYNMAAWNQFGDLPIQPARLVYFEADTPNVIGYREPGGTERVTCVEAVAYLETSGGTGVTRCCQAEMRVSCLAGDFSPDIPMPDEACIQTLRETFGVPASLQVFAQCPEGGNPEMTVAQMDSSGNISWKSIRLFELNIFNYALRCAIAPALLALAVRAYLGTRRKPDPKRQIPRW